MGLDNIYKTTLLYMFIGGRLILSIPTICLSSLKWTGITRKASYFFICRYEQVHSLENYLPTIYISGLLLIVKVIVTLWNLRSSLTHAWLKKQ